METLLKEPKYSIIPFDWKVWYYILSQFNVKEYYDDFYENIDWDNLDDEESLIRKDLCDKLCDIVWEEYIGDDEYYACRYLDKLIPILYNHSVCKAFNIPKAFNLRELSECYYHIYESLDLVGRIIQAYTDNYDSFSVLSDSSRNMLEDVYEEFCLTKEILKCVEYVDTKGKKIPLHGKYKILHEILSKERKTHNNLISALNYIKHGMAYDLRVEYNLINNLNDLKIILHKGHGISAYALIYMIVLGYCRTDEELAALSNRVQWKEYDSLTYYEYSIPDSFNGVPLNINEEHHYNRIKFNDNDLDCFRLFVLRGVFDDAIKSYRCTYYDYEKFIFKVYLAQITKDRSHKLNILNKCLIEENRYLLSNFFHFYRNYISSPYLFYDEVVRGSIKTIQEIFTQFNTYGWLCHFMSELDTFIWNKTESNVNPNCILADIHFYLTENSEKEIYNYAQYLYYNNLKIQKDIYEKLQTRIDEITNQNNIYINYISDIIKNEQLYDSHELEIQQTDVLEDEKKSADKSLYYVDNVANHNKVIHPDCTEHKKRILEELRNSKLISYEDGFYYVKTTIPRLCMSLVKNNYIYIKKDHFKGTNINEFIQLIKDKRLKKGDEQQIRDGINWDIIEDLEIIRKKGLGYIGLSDTKGKFTGWIRRYPTYHDLLNQLLLNYKEVNKNDSENS